MSHLGETHCVNIEHYFVKSIRKQLAFQQSKESADSSEGDGERDGPSLWS